MKTEMTLDEAILHCEEVADRCDNRECANEHRQLAEWLKELKERRASELSSAQPNLQLTCNQLATNLQPTRNLASNDCISREAAIDALRYAQHRFTVADEAGGIGTVKWSEDVIYFAAAERILTELPSAQPDIIHCGECKYYDDSDGCFFSTATTGADGFCHWAERKDGETDGRPD